MYAVAVSLVPPDGKPAAHLTDVSTYFRARSTEDDILEHVRVRADADGIDLVLFLSTGAAEAELAAVERCRQVITVTPELAGWTIGSCEPIDLRL